jgi:hypothetical protein
MLRRKALNRLVIVAGVDDLHQTNQFLLMKTEFYGWMRVSSGSEKVSLEADVRVLQSLLLHQSPNLKEFQRINSKKLMQKIDLIS